MSEKEHFDKDLETQLFEELGGKDEECNIPEMVNDKILHFAHQRAASVRRKRKLKSVVMRWSVAALVLCGIAWLLLNHIQPANEVKQAITKLEGQKPTILEAYRLALKVKHSEAQDLTNDFNQDGVVDSQDVEKLALIAVAIPSSGE